jgi:hypothetical protein
LDFHRDQRTFRPPLGLTCNARHRIPIPILLGMRLGPCQGDAKMNDRRHYFLGLTERALWCGGNRNQGWMSSITNSSTVTQPDRCCPPIGLQIIVYSNSMTHSDPVSNSRWDNTRRLSLRGASLARPHVIEGMSWHLISLCIEPGASLT